MKFVFEDLDEARNLIRGDNQNRANCNRLTTAPFYNLIRCLSEFNPAYNDMASSFSVEEKPETYIICVGTHNDPQNWGGGEISEHENYPSAFENISDVYLTDLRNGKALLLFDNSLEGFHEDWVFEYLHFESKRFNINPNQIVYVTGNLIVEEQYQRWLINNPHENKINPIPYPNFQTDVFVDSRILPKTNKKYPPTFEEQLKYKTENVNSIKLFSNLNKKPRMHRVNFYKLLYFNNLLKKGLVSLESFGNHDNDFGGNRLDSFCGYSFNENFMNQIKETLPSRIYGKSNEEHSSDYYVVRFHPQVALDTWVQVVSETYFYDDYETLFLSEKTFKVIAESQPFIILGNKGSLKQLKKLGYKTFGNFFDESYDELEGCKRMDAIIELLKQIDKIEDKLSWFKSMKDVLEHNKKTLDRNCEVAAPYVFTKVNELYKSLS